MAPFKEEFLLLIFNSTTTTRNLLVSVLHQLTNVFQWNPQPSSKINRTFKCP